MIDRRQTRPMAYCNGHCLWDGPKKAANFDKDSNTYTCPQCGDPCTISMVTDCFDDNGCTEDEFLAAAMHILS